jgi:hypothetical protein
MMVVMGHGLCVCFCVRKERKLNCLSVCLCVCVNEIPTLIFYVRTLSNVSSLIWMPLMDGRH